MAREQMNPAAVEAAWSHIEGAFSGLNAADIEVIAERVKDLAVDAAEEEDSPFTVRVIADEFEVEREHYEEEAAARAAFDSWRQHAVDHSQDQEVTVQIIGADGETVIAEVTVPRRF